MPMTPEEIRALVVAAMPGAEVLVRDTTGGGDHFEIAVGSRAFEGVRLVDQHRRVHAALGDAMRERIHAVALKTYVPK